MKKIKDTAEFSRKEVLLIGQNTAGEVMAMCVLYTNGEVDLGLVLLSHVPGSSPFCRPLWLEWERNAYSSILTPLPEHR